MIKERLRDFLYELPKLLMKLLKTVLVFIVIALLAVVAWQLLFSSEEQAVSDEKTIYCSTTT